MRTRKEWEKRMYRQCQLCSECLASRCMSCPPCNSTTCSDNEMQESHLQAWKWGWAHRETCLLEHLQSPQSETNTAGLLTKLLLDTQRPKSVELPGLEYSQGPRDTAEAKRGKKEKEKGMGRARQSNFGNWRSLGLAQLNLVHWFL